MLQLSHISKSYNIQPILDDVSFVLNDGDRAGLIGPNAAGKTTLLRIIARLETPDAGQITLAPHTRLGYLPQGQDLAFGDTLSDVVGAGVADWNEAKRRMDTLSGELAGDAMTPALLEMYGDAVAQFEALGGYTVEHRIDEILDGLGLKDLSRGAPVTELSGGQRTRLGLARLLLSEPNLLMLDEPTNHLDVDALEWLEGFLQKYRGAALIVSHDRTFLDRSVSQILELDSSTHRVTAYPGNYSAYEAEKTAELDQQWQEYQDQREEVSRLQGAARHLRGNAQFRRGGKADTNDKFAKAFFANRSQATMSRAKNIEQRVEKMQRDEKIDKPARSWKLKLDFGETERTGQFVLTLDQLGHGYGESWLFRQVEQTLRYGDRVALVGPNGSGKTTLLRIIVGELTPREGKVQMGANVRPGYMPQELEILDGNVTPLALIRGLTPLSETDARHFLHFFLFEGDHVFTPVAKLSYGERARLHLAKLVAAKANALVLDEPINHLDIPSRQQFEAALDAFPGTILVAAHDRAFIDRFATRVWAVENGSMRAFPDLSSLQLSHSRR